MTSLPRSIDLAARDPLRAFGASPFGIPYLEATLAERRALLARECAESILDLATESSKIASIAEAARDEVRSIEYALRFFQAIRDAANSIPSRPSGDRPVL